MKELVIKIGESTYQTIVELDNKKIGFIQNIVVELNAQDPTPHITITFPDLRAYDSSAKDTIADQIQELGQLPGVNIILEPLSIRKNDTVETPTKEWTSAELPNDPSELSKWDNLVGTVKVEE